MSINKPDFEEVEMSHNTKDFIKVVPIDEKATIGHKKSSGKPLPSLYEQAK